MTMFIDLFNSERRAQAFVEFFSFVFVTFHWIIRCLARSKLAELNYIFWPQFCVGFSTRELVSPFHIEMFIGDDDELSLIKVIKCNNCITLLNVLWFLIWALKCFFLSNGEHLNSLLTSNPHHHSINVGSIINSFMVFNGKEQSLSFSSGALAALISFNCTLVKVLSSSHSLVLDDYRLYH